MSRRSFRNLRLVYLREPVLAREWVHLTGVYFSVGPAAPSLPKKHTPVRRVLGGAAPATRRAPRSCGAEQASGVRKEVRGPRQSSGRAGGTAPHPVRALRQVSGQTSAPQSSHQAQSRPVQALALPVLPEVSWSLAVSVRSADPVRLNGARERLPLLPPSGSCIT